MLLFDLFPAEKADNKHLQWGLNKFDYNYKAQYVEKSQDSVWHQHQISACERYTVTLQKSQLKLDMYSIIIRQKLWL